jgi:hypothetical protein
LSRLSNRDGDRGWIEVNETRTWPGQQLVGNPGELRRYDRKVGGERLVDRMRPKVDRRDMDQTVSGNVEVHHLGTRDSADGSDERMLVVPIRDRGACDEDRGR